MNWDVVLLEKSPISCNTKKIFQKCSVSMSVYCFKSMLPLTRTNLNIPWEKMLPMSLQSHLYFGDFRIFFFSFLRSCQKQWNPSGPSKFHFFSSVNTSLHFSPNKTYFLVQLNLAFMWCSFLEGAFCPFQYSTLGQFFNVLHMVQCETLMSPGSWIWETDFPDF